MLLSLEKSCTENTKEVRYEYEQQLSRESPLSKKQVQATLSIQ